MATLPLSVQLYTLRTLTSTDMAGTLRQVADIGYRHVELAGYGNLRSATEMAAALAAAGLTVSGSHVPLADLAGDLGRVMDENDQLGNRRLICPWLDESLHTARGFHEVAQTLERAATTAAKRAFTVCYHNHDFEFKYFQSQTGWDILMGNTDPRLVKAELDVYWVKRAGLDPITQIRKLSGRLELIHLKDMASTPDMRFAEVGTGLLDFPAIVQAASDAGAAFGVVEQDDTYGGPPLESIRRSHENLCRMNLARN